MNWIRLETGWERDPRLRILRSRLGNEPEAMLLPLRLWCLCADFYMEGRIVGEALKALPAALEWEGDAEALLPALEAARYVFRDGDGIEVEGWETTYKLAKSYRERTEAMNKSRLGKPPPTPPSGDRTDKTDIHTASRASSRASSRETTGWEEFWKAYPKHKNQEEAEEAWKTLNPDAALQRRILVALVAFKDSEGWKEKLGQYIPKAEKWIADRAWERVHVPTVKPTATPFSSLTKTDQDAWRAAVLAQAATLVNKPNVEDPETKKGIMEEAASDCRMFHKGDWLAHATTIRAKIARSA